MARNPTQWFSTSSKWVSTHSKLVSTWPKWVSAPGFAFFLGKDKKTQLISRVRNRTLNLHVASVHGAVVWVMSDVLLRAAALYDDHGDDTTTCRHDDNKKKMTAQGHVGVTTRRKRRRQTHKRDVSVGVFKTHPRRCGPTPNHTAPNLTHSSPPLRHHHHSTNPPTT